MENGLTNTATISRRRRRTLVFLGSALIAFLSLAGVASAQLGLEQGGESDQGATDAGAGDNGGLGAGTSDTDSQIVSAPADTGSGSLALTGGDVSGLALLGAATAGAGMVLVLTTRRRTVATVTA
jgi:hypothetical protein